MNSSGLTGDHVSVEAGAAADSLLLTGGQPVHDIVIGVRLVAGQVDHPG